MTHSPIEVRRSVVALARAVMLGSSACFRMAALPEGD
jgi:hypothetical protein